jgi:hypothetical protein
MPCEHIHHSGRSSVVKREYSTWKSMKNRCLNSADQAYHRYGAKGVTVCSEWLSFECFVKDMGPRPKGMSLGRIDNNKGYCKDNCRWETKTQQNRNRSNCRRVTIEGVTKNLSEWAEEFNLSRRTLTCRLDSGLTSLKELSRPVRKKTVRAPSKVKAGTVIEVDGISRNITEWAKACGVTRTAIAQRIKYGWTPEKAVSTVRKQRPS